MKKILLCIALIMSVSATACSFDRSAAESEPAAESASAAESVSESSMDEEERNNISAAIGEWVHTEEDGTQHIWTIKGQNEAYLTIVIDSDELYFDENKNLWILGKKFSPDKYEKAKYEFEDCILTVRYEGKFIIAMEKTDDSEDLFGDYIITGGKFLDRFRRDENGDVYFDKDVCVSMSENKTILSATRTQVGFGMTKDHITRTKDGKVQEGAAYKIDGDTMIMTSQNGEEMICTRKK